MARRPVDDCVCVCVCVAAMTVDVFLLKSCARGARSWKGGNARKGKKRQSSERFSKAASTGKRDRLRKLFIVADRRAYPILHKARRSLKTVSSVRVFRSWR